MNQLEKLRTLVPDYENMGKLAVTRALLQHIEKLENPPKFTLPPMDAELLYIFNTKPWTARDLAALLSRKGPKIKTHLEEEVGYVMHWMLGLYFEHGAAEWRAKGSAILKEITDAIEAPAEPAKEVPAK